MIAASGLEESLTDSSPPVVVTVAKKKVAPLIESRHEWLQEQEQIHKRQSIRDEDIPRSAVMASPSSTSAAMASPSSTSAGRSTSISGDPQTKVFSQVHVPELASHLTGGVAVSPLQSPERAAAPSRESLTADADSLVPLATDTAGEDPLMVSMDLSLDSLDQVDREYWGDARRHKHPPPPELMRDTSECTVPTDNTTTTPPCSQRLPLARLQVADSQFLGYAQADITSQAEVLEFVARLRQEHPHAAHLPYAYSIPAQKNLEGFDEDQEPPHSTGPALLEQVRQSRHEKEGIWLFPEEAGDNQSDPHGGTCVAIVRYFGGSLLGVTNGRLTQCYERIAQLTLHRLFRGCHVPLQLDFTSTTHRPSHNLYGLAGGDTELHLNVIVQGSPDTLMTTLLDQLNFEGFQGAEGEILPRLQNLQADFYRYDADTHTHVPDPQKGTIIPIYRYPGNYQGAQWETFPWSEQSLEIKRTVEAALPHFYHQQRMNHCVTNYYRTADDHIAHHSDKDLDLDKTAAIVSVSIGGERVLELRRRAEPRDLTRLILPHGSMLVLGPVTNQYFTHSILPAQRDSGADADTTHPRISLTLRHVTTYMDTQAKRLFGQGVEIPTLQELRRAQRWDSLYFVLGFGAAMRIMATKELAWQKWLPYSGSDKNSKRISAAQEGVVVLGSAAAAWWSYRRVRRMYLQRKEERAARQFFTSTSTSGTKY